MTARESAEVSTQAEMLLELIVEAKPRTNAGEETTPSMQAGAYSQ